MADQKLTALTAVTDLADSDLVYVVDGVGGTPSSKKITGANLKAAAAQTVAASGTYVAVTQADSLWVPAEAFLVHSGGPTRMSFAAGMPAHLLANGDQIAATFEVPSWFATANLIVVTGNIGTGTGDYSLRTVYVQGGEGDNRNAGAVAPAAVLQTAAAQFIDVRTTVAAGVAVTAPLWSARVWRTAGTLVDRVAFLGLIVERVA